MQVPLIEMKNARGVVESILHNDMLDDDATDEGSKCAAIEEIIPIFHWHRIQAILFEILLDGTRSTRDHDVTAQVFWGACLDKRAIEINITIALLYLRLGEKDNPYGNNLIWSIASRLKKVGYLSDYDPTRDPEVLLALEKLGFPAKL